jgi:spore germination cell wall hydrolase CwlJ-like protein
MAQHRLTKRRTLDKRGIAAILWLGVLTMVSSCVMPAIAGQSVAVASGSSVTIQLGEPTPFNPAVDPALLMPVAFDPVTNPTPGSEQLIDQAIAAQLAAQQLDPAGLTPAILQPNSLFQPGSAASSFSLAGRSPTDMLRASLCLTSAIYYEAANEPDDGQRAVAQVVLNRTKHPAYPNTVCGVVYQGTERNDTLCQFTFGCDGAMARAPSSAGWARARRIAQAALSGYVFAPVGLATHYHTLAVAPSWRTSLVPTAIIGAHIFYRMPGGAGSPMAFHASYRGFEPTPAPKPKLYVPPSLLPLPAYANAVPIPYQVPTAIPAQAPAYTGAPQSTASIAPTRSVAADRRYVQGALPESDILPEYQNSGQWISK